MSEKKNATRYCKEQLVKSGKFPIDTARAVLKENTEYTVEEAEEAIRDYYEREVR